MEERKYILDEAKKSFIVSHTKEVEYDIEGFKKLENNLKENLEQLVKWKEQIEKDLKEIGGIPNKEKLQMHIRQHKLIDKYTQLEKLEKSLKELNAEMKKNKEDLEEIEPKIKILEELK